MHNWKAIIEKRFGQWGNVVSQHPKKIIVLIFMFTALLGSFIPQLRVDTSLEGFLKANDPAMITYEKFRREYGRDEFFAIAVKSENIFTLEFLQRLDAYHKILEKRVPYLQTVDSLINVRSIYGENDELVIEDLLEKIPENDSELADIKQRALSNPAYVNSMLSRDATLTMVLVKLQGLYKNPQGEMRNLGDVQIAEAMRAVKDVTDEVWPQDTVVIAGTPAINAEMSGAMMADMTKFMLATFAIVAMVLFALFRRISAVLLPLLAIGASMFSMVALMAILKQSWQMPSAIMPSFLIAVGVGNSIHFLTIFFQKYEKVGNKAQAITYSLSHNGVAMLLTSLTTSVGFFSFATSEMVPIANLGIFSAVGVLLTYVYSVMLLPALMILIPIKQPVEPSETVKDSRAKRVALVDRIIFSAISFSMRMPRLIVFIGLTLGVLGLGVVSQIKFTHNPLEWMPEDSNIRQATAVIDKKMGGTISVELLVDTGVERGVVDPEFLRKLQQFTNILQAYSDEHFAVGKVTSITDIVKETNKALFDNKDENYVIPTDKDLIAQELFLVESGSADDLFRMIDADYRQARVTVVMPWIETMHYPIFLAYINQQFNATFKTSATLKITGITALLTKTFVDVIISMATSYVTSSVVITLMMIGLLSSLRYGLLSMIPNFLPSILTIALMKILGDPLDMFTMLIGSIATGLAVDDTIHFMLNFRHYYYLTGSVKVAVEQTLHTSGRAMLVTSIVLSSGFFVYMLSDMKNLYNFGFYTGVCIVLGVFSEFLMSPALLMLTHRNEPSLVTQTKTVADGTFVAEGVSK